MKKIASLLPVTLVLFLSGCESSTPTANTGQAVAFASSSGQSNIGIRHQANAQQNFVRPENIIAPKPITGNSGKYMSPFTSAGDVALWAKKREAVSDNGSDLAASAGSYAGQQVANQALSFLPFGLGGMVGNSAGDAAGRAATTKTIQPTLPTPQEAKASSDISFNSLDKLAVYMYAKNSSHPEYARILALTEQVYPELRTHYEPAINKASKTAVSKIASTKKKKEK